MLNMISCMLRSRTYVSPVGVFFMIAVSLAQDTSTSICSIWDFDHDSENNLDSSDILWEKKDCPLIDCTLLCGQSPSCRSFFHHPLMDICLGSQSFKRGLPASQLMQQGWKYYTQRRHCDGDYVYNQTLRLCYKLHNNSTNYTDAMALCETEGAKLLIIRNEAELQHFMNVFPEEVDTWIGLRCMNAYYETKWWNGQPASHIPRDPTCPELQVDYQTCGTLYGGTYCNFECSDHQQYFICQREI